MDYDRDGDLDLVVSCPDKPYNGTYFFENPGDRVESAELRVERDRADSQPSILNSQPIFKPAVRIAEGPRNVQVSYIDGEPVVMTPGEIHADFRTHQYSQPIKLRLPKKIDPQYKRTRANQWKLLDWDNDGDLDVIVGLGVWDDYGWDDAWDENGEWTNGPLHGFVYLVENESRVESPESRADVSLAERLAALADAKFAAPRKLTTTDGAPIDVYGMPSPNFADFDNDGDLDLICGEFMDGFTFFRNDGTDESVRLQHGVEVMDWSVIADDGEILVGPDNRPDVSMDLQMITPVAIDWDRDGSFDLICGDEDGRVALLRNPNRVGPGSILWFNPPKYFRQVGSDVKFGALVTPFSVDWDGDGDEDLICGNTAGYIGLIENLTGGESPKWAAPVRLGESEFNDEGKPWSQEIRRQAGPQGSIQGPCEAKWGYTTLTVADWNGDGHLDIVVNGIWGRVEWHENLQHSLLRLSHPLYVKGSTAKPGWNWWSPKHGALATQWRTTPCVLDWNDDGLTDLVMLDHEGYLAFYERDRTADDERILLPPRRIFKISGPCEFDSRQRPVGDKTDDLLRLNANRAGASGRRKLCFTDWDGDGRLDLLVNSVNVNWLRNVRTDEEGFTWFQDTGPLDDRVLAGHTTSPTTVDWDKNGIPDLLVGAEDGRLYYKRNPRVEPTEIEKRKLTERLAADTAD